MDLDQARWHLKKVKYKDNFKFDIYSYDSTNYVLYATMNVKPSVSTPAWMEVQPNKPINVSHSSHFKGRTFEAMDKIGFLAEVFNIIEEMERHEVAEFFSYDNQIVAPVHDMGIVCATPKRIVGWYSPGIKEKLFFKWDQMAFFCRQIKYVITEKITYLRLKLKVLLKQYPEEVSSYLQFSISVAPRKYILQHNRWYKKG